MDPTQNPSATPNLAGGATPNLTPEMPAVNPATAAAPSLGTSPATSEVASPTPSEVAGAATSLDGGALAAASPAVNPVSSASASVTSPVSPLAPASPETPVAPVTPAPSPAPTPVPDLTTTPSAEPATSVLEESGTPGVAAPVNPIIQPGGATTGLSNMDGLLSTDPIMKPEPLPAPDPVEEELKTPMKAAGLAPGSIGSASGAVNSEGKAETPPATSSAPANNIFSNLFKKKQTPSVAFNDPAKESDAKEPEKAGLGGVSAKAKKSNLKINKQTMIILIALAAVLVVVLIVILVMQLNSTPSSNNSNNSNNTNNSSSANTPAVEPEVVEPVEVAHTLSCARKMTAEELTNYRNSLDGMMIVEATFDNDDNLVELSNKHLVEYTDTKTGESMLVTESLIRTAPTGIDATNVDKFMLQVANDGGVDTDLKSLTSNYESLDFTCETL